MRLIAATLERVRQHQRLELSFATGFTLIGGPNEAGKSTVVEALHKVLFLKATASGRGVEELRSQLHSGLPEVELRFEAAGQEWLLRKRFAGASGTCQLLGSGAAALQGSAAEARLAELLQVSGPIEGRRIAQLPLRWAHLWMRQGEAGDDLLAQGGEAYALPQLVQQLQHGGGDAAQAATARVLESPLDRQVQELLQTRLEQQLTATGKVRAGSPLALAQSRASEAQQALHLAEARLGELEASMAQLAQIAARLAELEPQLQRLAAAEPLQQRLAQLRQQHQQQDVLQQQLLADQRQQAQLQLSLSQLQQQVDGLAAALQQGSQRRQQLEQQQQALLKQQESLGLQRDLAALAREAEQLQRHKQQFVGLQQQAEAVKAQLKQLPPLEPAQVRQLRQAEARLEQLQARCQGMATRVEVLAADQTVELDGRPLAVGEGLDLTHPALLQLGAGTRMQISPGGGRALAEAQAERQQATTHLQELRQSLALASSDAAEALLQQRQQLEGELANLRRTAATIPWAQLDAQLEALAPRRQRLQQALTALDAAPQAAEPQAETAIEQTWEQLKQQLQELGAERRELEAQLAEQQHKRDGLTAELQRRQGEAGRLHGAIASTTTQLQHLQAQGNGEALAAELAAVQAQLEATGATSGDTAHAAQQLQRLGAEKDTLLTQRGQHEQICRSLGALDPTAEVEQLQAAWEQAEAERQAIERTTRGLQRLQEAFHQAQQQAASHYCAPLQQALSGYLEALGTGAGEALLDFDPQQGFGDLRLQRVSGSFSFGQLSGGMREQLGAALRLALAEVLQGAYGGCLPLLLDDAFSNSDPERLGGVRRMLQRAVDRGLQVVLFSCTPAAFEALAPLSEQRLNLG